MSDFNDILEEANKLIFAKCYEEAEAILSPCLEDFSDGTHALAQMRYIELAIKQNTVSKVVETLQKRFKEDSSNPNILLVLNLAEQLGELISPDTAIDRHMSFLQTHPAHAGAYYGIAYGLEAKSELKRAKYNYQQSLNEDPNWHPSLFGLSQVFYKMNDEKRGDQYFYMFEEVTPYNVYGNFETHRALSQDFLEQSRFDEAITCLQSLSNWWVQNKGSCPKEIEIFESLAVAHIHTEKGEPNKAHHLRKKAREAAEQLLAMIEADSDILYFTAKILEEYDEHNLALSFYKKVLNNDSSDPTLIQKIGGQLLSGGNYDDAEVLFQEAYDQHPDNPEIRFCLLVSKLKKADVNIEEYLFGKERMRRLKHNQSDKVEFLALLHSLLAKFPEDPEVHAYIADVYLNLGNKVKAAAHYERMYKLESKSKHTLFKYADFISQYGTTAQARDILHKIQNIEELTEKEKVEVLWLDASLHAKDEQYEESSQVLAQILKSEPWNLSYLLRDALNKTIMFQLQDPTQEPYDKSIEMLINQQQAEVDWKLFHDQTKTLQSQMQLDLVYLRSKIFFLYNHGSHQSLQLLTKSASKFDAERGIFELTKLLNTNYDHPSLFWAIGSLYKEIWQLQTARMWFKQGLIHPNLSRTLKATIYMEIADCYIWEHHEHEKAIEYAKLALEIGIENPMQGYITLAHAFIVTGQMRQAQHLLQKVNQREYPEASYLMGLMHYRNGNVEDAKSVWKSLLTAQSESLKFHNIKQEVLKFYFDKQPYWQAN